MSKPYERQDLQTTVWIDASGHAPNRMPFMGVLCQVDTPSPKPPNSRLNRRVLLDKVVAEAALPSLIGMGVNVSSQMDRHEKTRKVGVITAARLDGRDVVVEGHVYDLDFPDVATEIKAWQQELGMSFEMQAMFADNHADPLVITQAMFTGATILWKADAAYPQTSIAAESTGEASMDELLELVKTLATKVETMEAGVMAEIQASQAKVDELAGKVGEISARIDTPAPAPTEVVAADSLNPVLEEIKTLKGEIETLKTVKPEPVAVAAAAEPERTTMASSLLTKYSEAVEDGKLDAHKFHEVMASSGVDIAQRIRMINEAKAAGLLKV